MTTTATKQIEEFKSKFSKMTYENRLKMVNILSERLKTMLLDNDDRKHAEEVLEWSKNNLK